MQRAGYLSVLVLTLLTSCATATHDYPERTISDRLFLGRNIPNGGGTVSDADFETFVREVITPRFPQGLTVWRAEGQWRGENGAVEREQTIVIEVIHEGGRTNERAIGEIAEEYKKRFHQEAVMRVTTPGWMQMLD